MSRRYYSTDTLVEGAQAILTGSEAHHLQHVLRAKPGTEVVLFDGQGAEFDAVVVEATRSHTTLDVGQRRAPMRELSYALHLAVAPPKADRQRSLVEKAVELGAATLTPLVTQYSLPQPPNAISKWRRYVIEASKQCGRNRLMTVEEPLHWTQWLAQTSQGDAQGVRFVAHPGGASLQGLVDGAPETLSLAVGPEGGFTAAEIEAARAANWETIDLGPRILRIETAVAMMASLAALRRP